MLQQSNRSSDKPVALPQPELPFRALEEAANAIFITDESARIVWVNKAFTRLCGYSQAELVGQMPSLLSSGMHSKSFYTVLWQTILSKNAWRGTITNRKKDGAVYTVDETITPLLDEAGEITHFISIQEDVTRVGPEQEKERFLAYHDILTGLPNRALFDETLKHAMQLAAHVKDVLAIMFLDLDKFKPVNDCFGHETGDRLLQAVGERLHGAVRKSDMVARIGGDEFAILLQGHLSKDMVVILASKLANVIAQPFLLAQHMVEVGLSIGIAMYPADGDDQEMLVNKADRAMYAAKSIGGNSFRFFDAAMA